MSIFLQIVIFLFLVFADVTIHSTEEEQDLWESAKRELAKRTRRYIRHNPISDDLRTFIDELGTLRRRKRQDHNNMYAIKDGEVVPLAKLEEQLNTDSNLGENFTVVPLIIPIALENTVTLKDKQRTIDDEDFGQGRSSERAILGRAGPLGAVYENNKKADNLMQVSGTEETVIQDIIDEKLKSTSESTELNKVLEDVQSLISAQKKGSSKEGALCNVSGHWDSESGGTSFHIRKTENGAVISMKPTEPPKEDGFIIQNKWNVTATIPFAQSSQVIITLTAYKGRRVALFLGECRVCDGSEAITGDWLVGRTSSNCKDQKASHSFIADVFRKNNVDALREAHMKKISGMTTAASTSSES